MTMKFPALAVAVLALAACGETPAAGQKTEAPAQTAGTAASLPSPAAAAEVAAETAQKIKQTLESRYADRKLKVEAVGGTPMAGLYEVLVNGKQIVYTDASGDYMLVGDLIRTHDGQSLTEARKAVVNAVDFGKLPFEYAIKEVRGNGKLQVAVFSDPDCPFCKRLEHEFAKMTDITIYNFMMPIPQLHPDAPRKAVQIMCQPDPTAAWLAWMREGKEIPQVAQCANHVDETTKLGESFGFNGTPTIVFPNGQTQAGYAPMPQLEEIIKANQKQ